MRDADIPAYIQALKDGIKNSFGCDSTHINTVLVTETHKGQKIWEGDVEVFALHNNPEAKRAYSWGYPKEGRMEYISFLHVPPVDSPLKAVQASIIVSGDLF